MPVLAADDELKTLSDQQLLAVYDAIVAEILSRNLTKTTEFVS